MKYKLINRKTNKQHFCEKVTIDGFDYYLIEEFCEDGDWFYISISNKIEQYNKTFNYGEFHPHKFFWSKVIATNNPNMNIPKVIDLVEILAYQHDIETFLSSNLDYGSFVTGYDKSQQTHPFTDDDMIEFVEWVYKNDYKLCFDGWCQNIEDKSKTTKELFKIWKDEQPKILYYE